MPKPPPPPDLKHRHMNVSERSVKAAKVVEREAVPELVTAVERGMVSVSAAADVARLPEPEQRLIDMNDTKAVLNAAKAIRAERAIQPASTSA